MWSGLHSHAIGTLVSMTLASILKESYIIFVWGMLYDFDDFLTVIYDFLLFNFMSMCSVGWNPRNPHMKLLHSHAIESLVSVTLASILKENCIKFAGWFTFEFYVVWDEIYILYINTMFHITLRTIYYTSHVSKSS